MKAPPLRMLAIGFFLAKEPANRWLRSLLVELFQEH
jgi:hypothetical protein